MRMYGIRISVGVTFLLFTYKTELLGQFNCPCNKQDCGIISTSLKVLDNDILCVEKTFLMQNLTTGDVDYYIWDWQDGKFDTVFNKNNTPHFYKINEEDICEDNETTFEICLLSIKKCNSNKFSCHSNRSPVTVKHPPRAKFTTSMEICIDKIATFQSQSCNVDETLDQAYCWDFGDGSAIMCSKNPNTQHQYKKTGPFQVTLTVMNSCGSHTSTPQTVNVVDYPNSDFTVSENVNNNKVCVGDTVCIIDNSNVWANKINGWTFPTNNIFTDTAKWKLLPYIRKKEKKYSLDTINKLDTIKFVVLQPTSTPLRFTLTADNECGPAVFKNFDLTVIDKPITNIQGNKVFCETGNYTPTLTNTISIDSAKWTFQNGNPSFSNSINPGTISFTKSGIHNVEVTLYYSCGSIKLKETVTVNSRDPINIINYKKVYCSNSITLDTFLADTIGGTWKSTGPGLTNNGVFNPKQAGVGDYIITYTIGPPGCQSQDTVHVKVVPSVTINILPVKYCEDDNIDTLVANPSGGTWLGIGIIDPNIGIFDPSKITSANTVITYEYNDGNCISDTPLNIKIDKLPTFTIKVSSDFCLDGGQINLTNELVEIVNPPSSNTVFYIDNIQVPNNYNLASLSTGQHTVIAIHTQGECVVSDTGSINIKQKQVLTLSPNDTVCINDKTYQLTANVAPGTWSGTGVNPTTGLIDLSVGINGNGIYNYVAFPMSSCEVSGSVKIKINDPANSLSVGTDTSFCFGPTNARLFGSPSNGTWTGPSINPSGVIDLTALKNDTTYTFEYCINDNAVNNCQACKSKKLTIHSLPQPAFSIDSTTCVNEIIAFTNTTTAGTYISSSAKWDFDDGNTSNSNPIAINTYDAKGSYNVSLSLTNVNNCSNTYFQAIKVTTKPEIDFELNKPPSPCAPFTISAINTTTSEDAFTSYWILNGKRFDTHNFGPITIDSLIDVTNYTLSLFTTNDCGQLIKDTNFIVNPYPRANFGLSNIEGCSPLKIDFSNTTLGRPKSFMWDLGNGKMVNDSLPPSQTYTTTDSAITIYHIRLIAKNDCGNDTIDRTVKVYPPNVRAFIESPDDKVCQYDSLSFIAFSTVGATNTWQVISPSGMISGAAGDTATIQFNESGRYKILLFAANCGVHSDSTFVDVLAAPLVDFKIPDFVCVNDTVSFINTSVNIGNSEWDFGDGNMSAESNPKHVYTSPGIYTIILKAWSSPDYCPNIISKEITIVGKPISSFIADTMNGCQPLSILFTNQSVGGLHYDWDFGDNTGNSTDASPKHTFDQSGTFKVKLTVYDANNCFTDTSIANIIVHPKPKADFSFEKKDYCLGYDSINVQNISTEAVGFVWKFQSNIDTVIEKAFFPTKFGNHNMELIAISDHNCKDTLIKNVLILASPIADFEVNNNSGCEDLEVVFENKSTYSDRFIWNFGNNVTSVNNDTTYIYTIHGQYISSLISINDNGCPNDTLSRVITVHPKPVAGFSFQKDKECGVPMNVTFSNNSTFYNDAEWLISGSSVSQDFNFNYVFNNDQKYNVDLIVENEYFCKDTIGKEVDIYLQPIAAFEVTDKTCEREEVIIENLSTYANAYEWTIDTKGMTNAESPSVVFEDAGSYNINLIAIYNEFCKDTISTIIPIQVFTKPTADFDYNTGYNNNIKGEVQFTNESIDFTSLLWHFGDGYSSDSLNPMHEYDINRPIEVQLNAYHENNGLHICIDSVRKVIEPEWIKTFYAPNALVPDHGDDLINKFKPVGIGIKKYHIAIFSPWGEKVWESKDLDENGSPTGYWDGKYQDKIVPQGAYTWRADITWEDGNIEKVMVGSVTVIR